jgi:hypothetical protein
MRMSDSSAFSEGVRAVADPRAEDQQHRMIGERGGLYGHGGKLAEG